MRGPARLGLILAGLLLWRVVAAAAPAIKPMGADEARQLLSRTGFDAHPAEIAAYAGRSRQAAVERLLAGARRTALTPLPASATEFVSPRGLRTLTGEQRKQFQREQVARAIELKDWWVTEMILTPSPLTERMTLFWHNHFTSSLQKVHSSALMARQNALLRREALGNFATLLHAVAKDPAMLVYLDTAGSRRGKPNENFARELMELFTLGEGHYTEQDIREAARAFTGWSIDRDSGEFLWRPFAHDNGEKVVFGKRGDFDGDAVLDLILANPQTARFVVTKLWREFVSPEPDPAEVERIAHRFYASGYDIRTALRDLLTSEAFYAPQNRGVLVKSPVDLVVGTMRQFDVAFSDALPLTFTLRALGQDLFSPPNVRGWPGGEAWIDSSTLLARRQFTERLFRVDESRMQAMRPGARGLAKLEEGRARFMRASLDIRFSGSAWMRQFDGAAPADAVERVLLPIPPAAGEPRDAQGVDLVRRITADPAYQLK